MRNVAKLAAFAAFAVVLTTSHLAAVPLVNGGKITLQANPTAVYGFGLFKVERLTIRVIPGYVCKAYVGGPGMDRATLTNVWSVLYPNATGGWSEEFTIEAPSRSDSVDISQIFVAGDCPGEQVNYFYVQSGVSSSPMRILSGSITAALTGNVSPLWGGTTTLCSLVRVQIIPGYVGKIRMYGQNQIEMAELYPNSGNPNQSSARSERIEINNSTGVLRPDLMYLTADVAGEKALVLIGTYN